jgi:predicted transcriptional regulator
MTTPDIGTRVGQALTDAGLSQRAVAEATGISQSSLSRIISGERTPKTPEVLAIAWATGHTVPQLTGASTVKTRVQCAARATNGSQMDAMYDELLRYLELDEYLDDQGIPAQT